MFSFIVRGNFAVDELDFGVRDLEPDDLCFCFTGVGDLDFGAGDRLCLRFLPEVDSVLARLDLGLCGVCLGSCGDF